MNADWDRSVERHEAWWRGEAVDRVLLKVYSPKASPTPSVEPTPPERVEDRRLDVDYRISRFEWTMDHTFHGGDAFPYLDTALGPGTLSLYLGAIPVFHESTVWYGKCFDDIATAVIPELDEANRYWQFSQEIAAEGVKRLAGRALVAIPDLIEGLDTLSSLLGNDELLLYLVDAPNEVHRLQRDLVGRYFDYYDRLYGMSRDGRGGVCFTSFQTYAPGRMAKVQCDFSAMIGPAMFEEFAAPYLAQQCERLDYSLYHLDGPCCLQHLDVLLQMPSLNAIQWTPGAGQPNACDTCYIPLYKKIRAAGKSVMAIGGTVDEARELVKELGPAGLDIQLWLNSQEEAEAVVRESFTW